MNTVEEMLLVMGAVMAASAPHLPAATYENYFKPSAPAKRNTPEIEAWNRAVEERKAERRARKGAAA